MTYFSSVIGQLQVGRPINRLSDTKLLQSYVANPKCSELPPIILSFGENWEGVAPGLANLLAQRAQSPSEHGYQLSMWGSEVFLASAEELIVRDLGIPTSDLLRLSEIAAFWSGSRAMMGDFATYLRSVSNAPLRSAFANPGYDYDVPLGSEEAFPFFFDYQSAWDSEAFLRHIQRHKCNLVVINAQHNPTAQQMSEVDIRMILEHCVATQTAILVDDAHCKTVEPGTPPVSALKVLISMAKETTDFPPWLAVRSLGKQYGCNGWGIGIATARPGVLEVIVNRIRPQREYNRSAFMQNALADYMLTPAALQDERRYNDRIRANRRKLWRFAAKVSSPPKSAELQVCTPFSVLPMVDTGVSNNDVLFHPREWIFEQTGVLLGDIKMSPLPSSLPIKTSALRVFLGVSEDVFEEALTRIKHVVGCAI